MLFQFWNFSRYGYIRFEESLLMINGGFSKRQINFTEIETIIKRKNSYKFILRNRAASYIAMNFISSNQKDELSKKIEELNAELEKMR